MLFFTATIEKIGINPFVQLPDDILKQLMQKAGKEKGPIPVTLSIAGKKFSQTLVKYAGLWRLYLNTPMRVTAGKDVGDRIDIGIAFNPSVQQTAMPLPLKMALQKDKKANSVFMALPPSRQKEIMRYIAGLKSEEAVKRNVSRAINFLKGKERFVGREKP